MNEEDAQRVLRALKTGRIMVRDENGDYILEITPKLVTEAIEIMQAEVADHAKREQALSNALPIGMAGDEPSAYTPPESLIVYLPAQPSQKRKQHERLI